MASFAMAAAATFAVLLATILLVLYLHFRLHVASYWAKRGVPHLRPLFLLGNLWRANFLESFIELVSRIHLENREKKILGIWMLQRPALMVTDLDLIKRILIKDFDHFRDRGMEIDSDADPLLAHLFALTGKRWRNLRVRLTPTFTSGKMKMMFPTMAACGRQLEEYLETPAESRAQVEVKDVLARFTTDVIASCAFGIESNSLQNPKAEFREFGRKVVQPSLRMAIMNGILMAYPNLLKEWKIRFFPKHVEDFFIGVVRDTVEYRERTQTTRNDFLQLLIQLMRAGKIEDVDKTPLNEMDDDEIVRKFSLNDAAAQCFIFFIAGFEASATILTFALYELALNLDIQRRLQEEIDENTEKGDVSYEDLNGMEYLDKVVHEVLRKYSPAGLLMRKCGKAYHVPELGFTIEEGMPILICTTGIHRDPDIYPDPERFDPERFTQEEKTRRDICAFLPFGEGPRNCIGNRFALMQIKVGLVSVLRRYRVEVTPATPIPIVWNCRSMMPIPVGGLPLSFSRRS